MAITLVPRHHLDPDEYHDYTRGHGLAILIYAIIYWCWTVVVGVGLAEIFRKRREKEVRMRNWRLIFVGVVGTHAFITTVFTAAWVGPSFNCTARFWVVSSVLPLCVAAFQIPNAELGDYYTRNRTHRTLPTQSTRRAGASYGRRWRRAGIAMRTRVLVGLGAVVQVTGTTVCYLGSRRFHPGYGLWGPKVVADSDDCFLGWEWVMAVVWQTVWAYGYGLVLLLHIRRVDDIYRWARETRIAVSASLFGLPLWLTFMFARQDAIAAIDTYAPPSVWFVPGFAVSQFVLIWFPLRGAHTSRGSTSPQSSVRCQYRPELTVKTMREVIRSTFDHFADYAARTKLNAEMPVFLRDVAEWKATWWGSDGHAAGRGKAREDGIKCFKHAALLYFQLVDVDVAEFPVNLNWRTRAALQAAFTHARYVSPRHSAREPTAPWEEAEAEGEEARDPRLAKPPPVTPLQMKEVQIRLADAEASVMLVSEQSKGMSGVPSSFRMDVFDRAYTEVEQDCFRNLYADYVHSGAFDQAVRAPATNV